MSSVFISISFSSFFVLNGFAIDLLAAFWTELCWLEFGAERLDDEFDAPVAGGAASWTELVVGDIGEPPSWYDSSPGVGVDDKALVDRWFIP